MSGTVSFNMYLDIEEVFFAEICLICSNAFSSTLRSFDICNLKKAEFNNSRQLQLITNDSLLVNNDVAMVKLS